MATLKFTDALVTDGIQNNYFHYSTLDFSQITIPVQFGYDRSLEVYYVAPKDASDPIFGGDWLLADKFILTSQNDYFEIGLELPVAEVWGGAGNDTLITDDDTRGSSLYGGAGGDLLMSRFQPPGDRHHLVGGDGNDTLVAGGNDEMSGGAGTDRFVLGDFSRPAFITDLALGTESVDMWRVFSAHRDYFLTFSDALASGKVRVEHQNGYTNVWYNPGDFPGAPEQLLTYIKGSVLPSQYDSTFSTNFANSYNNRPESYDKVLDGTANPARDHLIGGLGHDVLILGDTDEATANGGEDRFVLTNLTGASAFITDITDRIGNNIHINSVDMTKPLYEAGFSYSSFSEAKAAGTLDIKYDRGYTYLYYDSDGDHVAEHEFAHIKGISPVLVDNIYLVAPAQSYFDLHAIA
jgi:hypothetical protein